MKRFLLTKGLMILSILTAIVNLTITKTGYRDTLLFNIGIVASVFMMGIGVSFIFIYEYIDSKGANNAS